MYFFELQALALYQSSEILSQRLGEISYAGQLRELLLCLLGIIVDETLPVAYSSLSVDYLKPYGDRNWFYFFFSSMRGCEDSYMYIYCIFPPPVIGMLATYH